LKEDHRHARFVAEGITGLNHVRSQERVQTNLLMLKMVDRGAEKYCRLLEEQGIIAGLIGDDRVRLVFYKEIGARRLRRWCGWRKTGMWGKRLP